MHHNHAGDARTTHATVGWLVLPAMVLCAAIGCGDVNGALERVADAHQRSSDLLLRFTQASDASNRAVMADTDELSVTFAKEAETAKQDVQKDVEALRPLLQALGFSPETQLLQDFVAKYAAYDALDRQVLGLAVENSNLKAQRLSFGPAQQAADMFRGALADVEPLPSVDSWRVRALAATAIAELRNIQVLQAPHIADPDDAAMAGMEARMDVSDIATRNALKTLAPLVTAASRARLNSAGASLDRFMDINAQIVRLSRQNTNVRSLALSLDQKRQLTAPCEASLRALQGALAKRGYKPAR